MSNPTDKEIRKATAEILKVCDVQNTKLKDIRKQLEDKFQCSLTDKKDVIMDAFDKFISQNEDLIAYNDAVAAENEQPVGDDEENGMAPAKKSKSKGGFAAEVHLTSELAEFLGGELMPRTQVTKLVWAYIKEHQLQDEKDKRKINCDAALEKVLKRKSVHMFTMTKILSGMMKSPKEVNRGRETEWDGGDLKEERKASKADKKMIKESKEFKKEQKAAKIERKRKHSGDGGNNGENGSKKAKNSNFTISPALCSALNLQPSDARTEVVKKMWEYVRTKELQNPADKREIRLDAALQSVFKVKTCTMFSINKLIAAQMIRKSEN